MKLRNHRGRGLSLIEVLITTLLLAIVTVATLRVIGESRIVRSAAAIRTELTVMAQSALNKARLAPVEELSIGESPIEFPPESPPGMTGVLMVKELDSGHLEIDVRIQRDTQNGAPPVRLTTIRRGGANNV